MVWIKLKTERQRLMDVDTEKMRTQGIIEGQKEAMQDPLPIKRMNTFYGF